MRKLILAASLAALAVPAITPVLASAASSANQTFTVMTHSPQHLDTTSAFTGVSSPGGPVWAYDNLNLKYVVTPVSGTTDQWNVAITSQGSFAGFANPVTGAPDINNGSTKGTITYTVTSPNGAPNMANVPSQEPNESGIRLPIKQMFGLAQDSSSDSSIVQSGGYTFTYNKVDGLVYTQD